MQGMMGTMRVRAAQASDAGVIAAVYNEGIAEREATFETEPRHARDFLARVASERFPLLVAELDGQLVGWAGLAPYSERAAYAGIGEASVYVARSARGRGVGTELCRRLAEEATATGFHKLLGKVFPENVACVRMVGRCGFREVGLHRCHGRLDGRWRDVLLVERLLGDAHQTAAVEEQPSREPGEKVTRHMSRRWLRGRRSSSPPRTSPTAAVASARATPRAMSGGSRSRPPAWCPRTGAPNER
jgi:L-amino acid N-acyltransferase YncA